MCSAIQTTPGSIIQSISYRICKYTQERTGTEAAIASISWHFILTTPSPSAKIKKEKIMLFTSLHNQTTQSIAHCERLIEQLKQQLAAAQEQLNHLHQQQQGELTASSTAQTALEMVFKARRMIKVAYPNSPEAMAEFNRALMLDEGESNNSETPQPRLTETDEVIAVDVTVVPTPPGEPTDKSQPKYNGHEPNSNGHESNSNGHNQQLNSKGDGYNSNGNEPNSHGDNQQLILGLNPSQEISTNNKYLTISQLKVLPRAQLQALATMKKVATNGNRLHIANRLNNQVTAEDLAKESTSSTSVD